MSGYYEFEDEQDDDGTLDKTTVEAIRRGTSSIPDVEAAERLVDQVAGLMVAVATGRPRINGVKAQYAREYKALSAVLKRLGIKNPNSHADKTYGRGTGSGRATTRSVLDGHRVGATSRRCIPRTGGVGGIDRLGPRRGDWSGRRPDRLDRR